MKYLILSLLLSIPTVYVLADAKEDINFFDTKKAILNEIDKRIAAEPNNEMWKENRKCVELTKDHAALKACKDKMKIK